VLKEVTELADRYDTKVRTAMRVDVTAEDAILKEARRGEYDLIILGVTRRPGETLSFWQYGSRGARELGYVDPVCRKLESRWSWNLKKSRRGMTLSPIRRSSKTG